MRPTRRFWQVTAIVALLVGFAVLTGQPALLLAGGVVVALLVARQWRFLTDCRRLDETLAVDVVLDREYVRQHETTQVTAGVTLGAPAPVDVTVDVETPLAATGAETLALSIPAGERQDRSTADLTFQVAGTVHVDQPTLTLRSRDGLFVEQLQRGPSPSLVVEPRVPRNIHVGEGGQRVAGAFGAHRTGQFGQGTDPAELREYIPGDDVGDIDWKATARQNDLYVREYEVESDRRMVLLFDHRNTLSVGPDGETMCEYLREVALTVALAAESFDDPLGLYTVGDEGLTDEFAPESGAEHYRRVRQRLHDITPTTGAERRGQQVAAPATAGRKATALGGDQSAYATQLRPYFESGREYVRRIEGRPLFDVARTYVQQVRGDAQLVIFTDDTDRAALKETVKVARGGSGDVLVLLTPRVLFETESMTDLEATYERYTEFESFRRELAGIERVDAFEVAPGDRLEAVLSAGRNR